ncbi:hypothetical protein NQ317_011456 [Molorchus minor]|uniref:28S ribosomal protein S27, mitochondrial n=1 Tax=Molorchus minor TaxID=1323400 RepID=A0ABQ9IUY4_9CUCU|nr:hypothetical protein NQ317_011456 [Molorchus minor]
MLNLWNRVAKRHSFNTNAATYFLKFNLRTFLSPAYYCEEVWENRLNSPILQKIRLEELYHELDQRFQKTRQISAVDVDIFVNAAIDKSYNEEILDMVHKLRLSSDTGNTLNSTPHAVIRILIKHGVKYDLLNALDDRLNYGIFLDFYTANLLLDTFWKDKDYSSGTRVASQLMLQEEFNHPLSKSLSLLHCYNYLLKPEGWPEYPKPDEPEEEVKIRVRYLRNPYDDDHFDLRDPKKIVGKTLAMFTKGSSDTLSKSFHVLGLALFNKPNLLEQSVKECIDKNLVLNTEVLELIPDEFQKETKAVQETSETDIAGQCQIYSKWQTDRLNALEEQKKRLLTAKRLSDIESLQAYLKEKETKLWFFDKEENLELEIEESKDLILKPVSTKNSPKGVDETYVPPEIGNKYNTK